MWKIIIKFLFHGERERLETIIKQMEAKYGLTDEIRLIKEELGL